MKGLFVFMSIMDSRPSKIEGRDLLITLDDRLMEIIGECIEPQNESNVWSSRLGYYKNNSSAESERSPIDGASLRFGDGYYLMDFFRGKIRKSRMAVQPVSDSELVELGIGRELGNTVAYSELIRQYAANRLKIK